jgi:iron only hydrogenase large subunit-like protein
MGALVKEYLAKKFDLTPDSIYHVSVAPCFDKKLEASRTEFTNDFHKSKDVDCVLSTIEIEQILQDKSLELNNIEEMSMNLISDINEEASLYTHLGSGSGGYLENVLNYASKHLFNYSLDEIQYETLKNQDFKEVNVKINGEIKLKFAFAYGFRNIQNIVQKIKKNSCPYHYIEIMACPSGCLNGGGQLRDDNTNTLSKELLDKVTNLYNSVPKMLPENNRFLKEFYDLINDESNSQELLRKYFYTSYHEVKKLDNSLAIKW